MKKKYELQRELNLALGREKNLLKKVQKLEVENRNFKHQLTFLRDKINQILKHPFSRKRGLTKK